MDAVENGDMEKAQQMVLEAAKRRRYRKIKGDRGHHSTCNYHAAKLLSYISLYLLLTPSISFPLGFHQRVGASLGFAAFIAKRRKNPVCARLHQRKDYIAGAHGGAPLQFNDGMCFFQPPLWGEVW